MKSNKDPPRNLYRIKLQETLMGKSVSVFILNNICLYKIKYILLWFKIRLENN